jgi:hypothetical protein
MVILLISALVSQSKPREDIGVTDRRAGTSEFVESDVAPPVDSAIDSNIKAYYSTTQGIVFSYVPVYSPDDLTVTERENIIYLHISGEFPEDGQSIEVFDKEPEMDLAKSIEKRFLSDELISGGDCYVEVSVDPRPGFNRYERAEISYPEPQSPDAPFWENASRCSKYARTNGVTYFLYNQDIPDKYIYVKLGQAALAYDQQVSSKDLDRHDWSNSIRIIVP